MISRPNVALSSIALLLTFIPIYKRSFVYLRTVHFTYTCYNRQRQDSPIDLFIVECSGQSNLLLVEGDQDQRAGNHQDSKRDAPISKQPIPIRVVIASALPRPVQLY